MKIDASFIKTPASQAVLNALGPENCYFVGGCVRNLLLDEAVTDLDIATPLYPDVVIERATDAGLKAIPTGIDHGTLTILSDGQPYEVTTFRKDIETDGRHAIIAFADQLEDDAQRRDFTMNALYLTPDGGLVDPVSGLPDLYARHFRFIGEAQDRIHEDALRILRLFRFHAQYGRGDLNADARDACATNQHLINGLSRERVGQEVLKLLGARNPITAVTEMHALGILDRVLPQPQIAGLADIIAASDNPFTRAYWIAGSNLTDHLRLSRAQSQYLKSLTNYDAAHTSLIEIAYRGGPDLAREIRAIRAARGQNDDLTDDALGRAAKQVFPVKAADLPPHLTGVAIGRALKALEVKWIESGFALTGSELLGGLDD